MPFFRYDGSVRDPLGFAVAGASIGVYTQPATFPSGTNAVGTPLATIWAASSSNSATVTTAGYTNGFITFTLSAPPPADVVPGSFVSVGGATPATYNGIWQVASVAGNVVSVTTPYQASAPNPGTFVSGTTFATSALPNPFLSDNLGNFFWYALNTVPYTVQEFDPTYSRINPLILVDQAVVAAGAGAGTVTSVAMTGDGVVFNAAVTGSPISTSGTLTPVQTTQAANLVYASPASGPAGIGVWRQLVAGDFASGAAGSVTSVASTITTGGLFANSVTGSPITTTGTLAYTVGFANQAANLVLASPASGGSGAITARALVAADLPGGFSGSIATNQVAFGSGTNTIAGSSNFTWNNGTQVLNLNGVNGGLINMNAAADITLVSGTIGAAFSAHAATNVGVNSMLYTLSMVPGSTGTGGLQIAHNLGSGPALAWDNATGYLYLRKSTGIAGIGVATAAGTPNVILLPTSTGTNGQILITDGNSPQQLSWNTPVTSTQVAFGSPTNTLTGSANLLFNNLTGDMTITSPGGTAKLSLVPSTGTGFETEFFGNNDGTWQILPAATVQVSGGVNGVTFAGVGTTGTFLSLFGTTSGNAMIGVAAVAGTPNRINLPIATGTVNQALVTDGGSPQQASWASVPLSKAFAATTPTTPVSATNILASAPAGLYRVSYYSVVTTTGTVGTNFKLNFIYTDAQQAQTIAAFTNTTFTAGDVNQGDFIIQNQSTNNIQYSITETGVFTTHPVLALQLNLERIA